MKSKIALLLAGLCLLLVAAGCGQVKIAGVALGGPEPTVPPTRTPRPTFTPRPVVTDTPAATNTPSATNTTAPTATEPPQPTATRRPATAVPPTKAPPPPTAVPQPTAVPAPQYEYSFFSVSCEHSGGTYLEIYVYANRADPNSLQSGVKVRASYTPDGPPIGDKDETTDDYGKAQFTLAGDGQPVRKGTWYAWIVDSKGARISDMSKPVTTNGGDADNSCWKAKYFFAK